ncbi:hypothetical protein HHE02_09960 [Helicobacter heilmannii]|uniref:Uncharacterized protein n=2 Tax=Helicobacter TaxID=209 RepID=A0A0K2X4Z0_9HELI|nr:hypothetical protein BN341_2610 [Helicobacter heilmannii ASB1.4]CRF41472.1 hypothetical protein HAL011_12700 [Helicobacter ailurogastricus]CRF47701.1 hypothetical protein HHE02_09960 [Helicobacter heilmannii]CCM73324.1 hypothetical protein BN341_2650 [Helicobacter heilmannii ASB1.4]CRF42049.1 hypothetical protein HAL013_01990 [Helicobacter ailurogastricus]
MALALFQACALLERVVFRGDEPKRALILVSLPPCPPLGGAKLKHPWALASLNCFLTIS